MNIVLVYTIFDIIVNNSTLWNIQTVVENILLYLTNSS